MCPPEAGDGQGREARLGDTREHEWLMPGACATRGRPRAHGEVQATEKGDSGPWAHQHRSLTPRLKCQARERLEGPHRPAWPGPAP